MNILFGQLDSVPRIAAEGVLNSIWQGAVLAFLIYLLLRLFKRANATTKYSVWLVTLLVIICLPFLNMLASLRAPTTDEPALADNRPLEIPAPVQITEPSRLSTVPADAKRLTRTFDSNDTVTASVLASGSNKLSRFEMPLESRRLQESFSIQLSGEGWPQVFLILWMLGATIMIARLIRSYLSLQRLKAASKLLGENYQRRMSHWLKTCGIKRRVHLRGSEEITVPLMLGLQQPVILFPERLANDLAEDEFDQVLLHELAHVRRRDDWSNLAQKFIEAVFFFHPVVLWIARQLNAEREIACDQWVISMTGARRSYASCLARIFALTKAHRSPLLAPGAVAVKSHLSRRIETILKNKRNATPHLSTVGFIIPLCFLLMMVIQLSRFSPIIAVSARSNSEVETAKPNKLAGTSALDQSPLNGTGTTGWVTDLTSAIEDRGGVSSPGDSEAIAVVSSESSASSETLRLSAPDGEMTQRNAWIQMVESSGNISGTMQPIAFLSPTSNQQLEIPDGLPQSAINSSSPVQEQTASSATLSNGDTSLPSDFFKAVAALNNSAAQREALVTLLKRRGLTKENLIQSLVVAKGIDSDGEKAEFLENAAGVCTGDVAVLNAFFNAVSSLESPGEQRRVLIALLKSKGRDKGILNRILKAAANISSDGEKAELLERTASLYAIDNATLNSFLSVVSSINSSGERRCTLTAILRQNNLSNEIIIQTVRFARNISSDGEKADFLEKVAMLCPVNDGGVLAAYVATAASINSSQEQARALLAISKKKGIS